MDDADLVTAFRNGNREAFAELVRRYSRHITLTILRIVGDLEDARDLSQEVFLKAYTGLPRFFGISSFKTWLYTIALNHARDHVRKRRFTHAEQNPDTLPTPNELPGEQWEPVLLTQKIREEIEKLPEKQRLTLQLRIFDGLEYSEIARILGGTAGGARGNFFQAIKTLREKLKEIA